MKSSSNLTVPRAWLEAGNKASRKQDSTLAKKESILARVDMSAEIAGQGLCPACKRPMEPMVASGHSVLVCLDDRIAIPTKD